MPFTSAAPKREDWSCHGLSEGVLWTVPPRSGASDHGRSGGSRCAARFPGDPVRCDCVNTTPSGDSARRPQDVLNYNTVIHNGLLMGCGQLCRDGDGARSHARKTRMCAQSSVDEGSDSPPRRWMRPRPRAPRKSGSEVPPRRVPVICSACLRARLGVSRRSVRRVLEPGSGCTGDRFGVSSSPARDVPARPWDTSGREQAPARGLRPYLRRDRPHATTRPTTPTAG